MSRGTGVVQRSNAARRSCAKAARALDAGSGPSAARPSTTEGADALDDRTEVPVFSRSDVP
jgi:hypothetical protein